MANSVSGSTTILFYCLLYCSKNKIVLYHGGKIDVIKQIESVVWVLPGDTHLMYDPVSDRQKFTIVQICISCILADVNRNF